jgi:tRNA modification GTPase
VARSTTSTIAAIATSVGGGIGVVRLSGPHAEPILTALVRPWSKRPPTHKLHLTKVYDPRNGEFIDEVLAVVMRAPHSYTGEDVAEIHGHGGRLVMERILEAAIAAGAKLAQPGEFTRRAFEGGRIDLTRAEAVAQLIGARSQRALSAAQSLHAGALEAEIRSARGKLVSMLAELEGAIDFPDDAHDAQAEVETGRQLEELRARVDKLAKSYRKVVHDGAEVVLLGRVNAGKSSLLNALCGEERALVDAQAGTTRDLIEAEVDLGGVMARVIDTAGFSDSPSELERRGLELAQRRRGRADAFVLVVDGTVGFQEADKVFVRDLSPVIVAWNKRDIGPGAPSDSDIGITINDSDITITKVVETSARTGEGVDELKRAILGALGTIDEEAGALVVSLRQKEALDAAAAALGRAGEILKNGEPSELAADEGRRALNELGRVTGETVDAEVLDAIFARFCIGK